MRGFCVGYGLGHSLSAVTFDAHPEWYVGHHGKRWHTQPRPVPRRSTRYTRNHPCTPANAGGIATEDDTQKSVSWRGFHLASYWFGHAAHDDVEAFLAWVPITIGGTPIDDPCASWHANTTDFGVVTRLHFIRLYHNWEHETALCRYLDAEPSLRDALDVESCPDQSTLYTAWHDRFPEEYRDGLLDNVSKVVNVSRAHGVSVPERAFTAEQLDEDDADRSARSKRRLERWTAKDVWQTAKPLVGPVVDFDRPEETEIHDNAFLEFCRVLLEEPRPQTRLRGRRPAVRLDAGRCLRPVCSGRTVVPMAD